MSEKNFRYERSTRLHSQHRQFYLVFAVSSRDCPLRICALVSDSEYGQHVIKHGYLSLITDRGYQGIYKTHISVSKCVNQKVLTIFFLP